MVVAVLTGSPLLVEGSDEEDAGWCETGMGIVSRGSFLVYCSNPGTERLTPCLGIHSGVDPLHGIHWQHLYGCRPIT